MNDINVYFLIAIFFSIGTSIYAKQFGKRKLYIFVKPLTMLFIIALPLLEVREEYSTYAYLIMTGLIFSLLGDLFLLFPDKYFRNGLYSFFIAHIFYIFAFNQNVTEYSLGIALPIVIFISLIVKYLTPKLGGMKYPVIFYMLVISAMLYSGLNFDREFGAITYVSIGALLFIISDIVLAFNKFYKKISFSPLFILSTYFIAQLLFAMSI